MSLWHLLGGHVSFGSIIAVFVATMLHGKHKSMLMSILIYFAVALVCWIIGDWIFGPFSLSSITQNPHF